MLATRLPPLVQKSVYNRTTGTRSTTACDGAVFGREKGWQTHDSRAVLRLYPITNFVAKYLTGVFLDAEIGRLCSSNGS